MRTMIAVVALGLFATAGRAGEGRGYGEHLAAQLDELEDRRDGEERALVADLLGEDGGRSYL